MRVILFLLISFASFAQENDYLKALQKKHGMTKELISELEVGTKLIYYIDYIPSLSPEVSDKLTAHIFEVKKDSLGEVYLYDTASFKRIDLNFQEFKAQKRLPFFKLDQFKKSQYKKFNISDSIISKDGKEVKTILAFSPEGNIIYKNQFMELDTDIISKFSTPTKHFANLKQGQEVFIKQNALPDDEVYSYLKQIKSSEMRERKNPKYFVKSLSSDGKIILERKWEDGFIEIVKSAKGWKKDHKPMVLDVNNQLNYLSLDKSYKLPITDCSQYLKTIQ